jgi:hypothetical protein
MAVDHHRGGGACCGDRGGGDDEIRGKMNRYNRFLRKKIALQPTYFAGARRALSSVMPVLNRFLNSLLARW